MVAELVDNPTYRFADSRREVGASAHPRPLHDRAPNRWPAHQPPAHRLPGHRFPVHRLAGHRLRRVISRLPVAGDACRRPPAAVGAVAAPVPVPVSVSVSVIGSATRRPRGPSCGPGGVAARRAALRRRRAVAAAGLAVVIVCCWMATSTALGRIGGGPLATTGAPGGVNPAALQVWTVRPGDTLWSIAEAVDPNGDVRPLVDRLAAEVGGTALYPGETVGIPGR